MKYASIFEVVKETPVSLYFDGVGGTRLAVAMFPHKDGLVFFDVFWMNTGHGIHVLPGPIANGYETMTNNYYWKSALKKPSTKLFRRGPLILALTAIYSVIMTCGWHLEKVTRANIWEPLKPLKINLRKVSATVGGDLPTIQHLYLYFFKQNQFYPV